MGKTKYAVSEKIPLDGGVDEYHDTTEVAKNRKLSAVDIHIDGGKLRKRPGVRAWSTAYFDRRDGFHEYIDQNGVARLLVAYSGGVVQVDESNITGLDSGLTHEKLTFQTYRGRCYYNGANTQRKITNTSAARIGIAAPTMALEVSASGLAGNLTGTYYYKFTYVIEESGIKVWESDPSPISNAATITGKKGVFALSGSSHADYITQLAADTRINRIYVYRTTAGGSVFQLVDDWETTPDLILNGITENIADANLGALLETNHGEPTQGTICQGASNRMFWIDGNKIRHSELAYTESYLEYSEPTSFVELPGHGVGTGLKAVYNKETDQEHLYAFQKDTVNILPGADPLQSLVTLSTVRGCVAQETIVEWKGMPVFLSNQKTVEVVMGGRLVDITSRNIPKSMSGLKSQDEATAGLLFGDYYALCCQSDIEKPYNNQIWVCDLRTVREVKPGVADATWFKWSLNAAYILERKDGTVLMLDSQKGRIFELSLSQHEDSDEYNVKTQIAAKWRTKDFTFNLFARFHPRVLILKGKQKDDLTVTPHYGDEYGDSSSTTMSADVGTPFIMGQSVMGSQLTQVPLRIEGTIPGEAVGIWCGFEFEKSNYDDFFELAYMQFSYVIFQRF